MPSAYTFTQAKYDSRMVEVKKGTVHLGRLRRHQATKGQVWLAKPLGGVESSVEHPNRESAARAMDPNPEST